MSSGTTIPGLVISAAHPALATLPTAQREAAAAAITAAFPGASLEELTLLHGGLSGTLVCRIQVDTHAYVLRAIVQRSPLNDPARQFASMQAAASVGVAPPVLHANVEAGVCITAYVPPPPGQSDHMGDRDTVQLGELLRRLHQGPSFPPFLDAFELIEGGVGQLEQHGVTLPRLARAVMEQHQRVRRVLAPHLTSAPCHNDLNPGNVLSDGERLWLIDWDGACMGDPLFDVAGLLHWFGMDDERKARFLAAYSEGTPSAHLQAKLLLMEQVSWCFYMLVFLLISLGPDGVGALDAVPVETLPTFREALAEIKRGTLALRDVHERRRLSLIMAKQSLAEMAQPAFQAAMARLGESG